MQTITPNQTLTAKGPHHCINNPTEYDGPRYGGERHRMASDALDNVHFNPEDDACENGVDCSPRSPCRTAAAYLLATGRIAGVRGYIPTPQGRPTHHIAPEATGQGEPVGSNGALQAAPAAVPATPGKGTGTASGGRRKNGPKAATDKQLELLKSLVQQMNDLDHPEGGGDAEKDAQLLESMKDLTAQEASALIDGFMGAIKAMRREARQEQTQEESLVEGGMYRHGKDIYWIVRAKDSQRLYAKRVVIDDEGADLEYAGGMVRRLEPSQQLPSGEARQVAALYGKATGKCMVCSRALSNSKSIEAGIGPACREKL